MASFDQDKAVAELNQYWYSDATIALLVKEIEMHATKAAFLSTPSLFFALTKPVLRANSKVFEFDRQWDKDPGFVFYDFNKPEQVPANLWGAFDYIVVDPPFITREVWAKYAETVKLIAAPGAKFLFTSVIENHQMLEEVVDTSLIVPRFRPSIPKLTYQYHTFLSYPPHALDVENSEIEPEDPKIVAARQMANDMRESQNAFKLQAQTRNREGEAPLPSQEHNAAKEAGLGADPVMKWTYVPEGLTEYPEGGPDAAAAAAPPPSAEFLAVEARRNKLSELRTLVEETIKAAEGAIKPYAVLASEGASEEKRAEAEAKAAQQEAKKLECIAKLEEATASIAADEKTIAQLMGQFVAAWRAPLKEKGVYMERCADATRIYKSPIFNRQKELLAEMKTIKKKDAAAAKEAAAAAAPSA